MFQGCWQKTQNTCVRGRRQLYYSGQEQGPEVPVAARFPCPHPRVLWGHAGGTRCLPVSRDRSTEESVAFPVNRSKPALWGGSKPHPSRVLTASTGLRTGLVKCAQDLAFLAHPARMHSGAQGPWLSDSPTSVKRGRKRVTV